MEILLWKILQVWSVWCLTFCQTCQSGLIIFNDLILDFSSKKCKTQWQTVSKTIRSEKKNFFTADWVKVWRRGKRGEHWNSIPGSALYNSSQRNTNIFSLHSTPRITRCANSGRKTGNKNKVENISSLLRRQLYISPFLTNVRDKLIKDKSN